jgi:hypothetical protein
MTAAAPARTVTNRWRAVAVKSDVKTGHDIAYVTRGHASGCTGPSRHAHAICADHRMKITATAPERRALSRSAPLLTQRA